LPIFDYDAPEGLSQNQKRKRALELHHDCCRVMSSELLKFCEQRNIMQAANGSIYNVVPRLAFVAADFQQIQQNVALVGRGCHVSAHMKNWTGQAFNGHFGIYEK
jgi:coenzyme F420-reducing hydrogenase beta subunit